MKKRVFREIDRYADCEAVEIFNQQKITLDDATLLADSLFKDVNVNTLTLAIFGEAGQECVADLLSRVKKHTLLYVIQESSDFHIVVTFVTSISWDMFRKIFNHQLDICQKIHKSNVYSLQ